MKDEDASIKEIQLFILKKILSKDVDTCCIISISEIESRYEIGEKDVCDDICLLRKCCLNRKKRYMLAKELIEEKNKVQLEFNF
jgi:hypothetical protein